MTDGVWWFFLFWTPAYLKAQFDINPTDTEGMVLIFALYLITMLSILGGKLPTVFINQGMNPYAGRMRAMLIFAFFPLLVLLAQPLVSSRLGSPSSSSVSRARHIRAGLPTSSPPSATCSPSRPSPPSQVSVVWLVV